MVVELFFRYLDGHDLDDTNARIILYLLEHRRNLSKVTVTQLADECFVSPASITRFVQRFGFPSFADLKRLLDQETLKQVSPAFQLSPHDRSELLSDPMSYYASYGKRIEDSIAATYRAFNAQATADLARRIETCDRIFLFGFDSMIGYLQRFQGSLVQCDKVSYLAVSEEQQLNLSKKMREGDLCIVVSSFGQFFQHHGEVASSISRSKAHSVLLTQSRAIFNAVSLDETIVITNQPDPQAGSFNMEFYLEFLARYIYVRFLETHALS